MEWDDCEWTREGVVFGAPLVVTNRESKGELDAAARKPICTGLAAARVVPIKLMRVVMMSSQQACHRVERMVFDVFDVAIGSIGSQQHRRVGQNSSDK